MRNGKLKTIITWCLALFLLSCFYALARVCLDVIISRQAEKVLPITTSDQEVIAKARAFCVSTGIVCSGKVTVGKTGEPMPGIVNSDELRKWHLDDLDYMVNTVYSHGHYYGAYVMFEDTNKKERDGIPPYIVLGLGRHSNEIESYGNPMRFFELSRQYSRLKKSKEIPDGRFEYSPFISEQMAIRLIDSLKTKVGLPSDMFLEKIEKNMKSGVWNAIWLRKKDGYLYEGDGATMSISGATGELLAYKQKHQGVPCPTDLKIDRDRALELAWQKLHWKNPWLVFWNARDYYNVETELRIVPTGKFLDGPKPIKFEGSRLAWIVKFVFTGGLKFDKDKYMALHKAGDDRPYMKYLDEKRQIRKRMLFPENIFELRIDAINGSYIYADRVESPFSRWILSVFE